ncbi:MAG TPA: sigma-70 region 4 domain-containing protein, partial [Nannocystaceae bacterium]|nr:sigma-70 region 4 domain-containing protein [Nannocystaceae bacterium]
QQLPLETQMLLELHYWEAMPTREIGDALGVPKSTVTTWLHRARLELKAAIGTIGARESARASLTNDLERWATSLRELEAPYPGKR